MQALSLSLSPAGSGDKKVEFPSAPTEDEQTRLRISEVPFRNQQNQPDFSENFVAVISQKKNEADQSPTDPRKKSGESTIIETQRDDTVLMATIAPSENREKAALNTNGATLSSSGNLSNVSDIQSSQLAEPTGKVAERLLGDSKLSRTSKFETGLAPEVLADVSAKPASVPSTDLKTTEATVTAAEQSAEILSDKQAQPLTGETKSHPAMTAPKTALEAQGATTKNMLYEAKTETPRDQKQTQIISENKNLNLQIPNAEARNISKTDQASPRKSASTSNVDSPSSLKEPINLTDADLIEDVVKKRSDFKTFGQLNVSDQTAQNLAHASLSKAPVSVDGNLAITTSLTAPTMSTVMSPAAQIVSATPAAMVTNFNAVSQAILVANETAKGVAVQLDPPEMGRVYIDFIFNSDDSVNVVVKSELPDSHLLLRERSEQFLEFLKENGLENVNLSFEQGSHQNESYFTNEDAPKPLYLAASAEDLPPLQSTLKYTSKDVQNFDGLDLRL